MLRGRVPKALSHCRPSPEGQNPLPLPTPGKARGCLWSAWASSSVCQRDLPWQAGSVPLPTLPLGQGTPWLGSGPRKVPRLAVRGRGLCVGEDGTDPWESPQFTFPRRAESFGAMPICVNQGNCRTVLGPRGPPRTLEQGQAISGWGSLQEGRRESGRRGRDLGFGDRRRKAEHVLSWGESPARCRDQGRPSPEDTCISMTPHPSTC